MNDNAINTITNNIMTNYTSMYTNNITTNYTSMYTTNDTMTNYTSTCTNALYYNPNYPIRKKTLKVSIVILCALGLDCGHVLRVMVDPPTALWSPSKDQDVLVLIQTFVDIEE